MLHSVESPAKDLLLSACCRLVQAVTVAKRYRRKSNGIRARVATLSEPPIRVTIIADEAISRPWISAARRTSTRKHYCPTAAHMGCLLRLGHGKQSVITTGNTRGHLPYMCSTRFFLSSHTGEVATVKADRWSMNIPSLRDVGSDVGQTCSGPSV